MQVELFEVLEKVMKENGLSYREETFNEVHSRELRFYFEVEGIDYQIRVEGVEDEELELEIEWCIYSKKSEQEDWYIMESDIEVY